MYKSVSFNIYDLNLQDVVYKDGHNKKSSRYTENTNRKLEEKDDMPIPKPIDDFWKKPLIYNKK